jgi:hypothetical protein
MTNTDFTLFRIGYINPRTNQHTDCGETRGWYADRFVAECESMGLVAVVERTSDDQSLADFIINMSTDEHNDSLES